MNSFVHNPRTKAFTLVEMLVVMAIIGILAAILLPALSGGQRRAQRIFCENSLQEIGVAFHVFSNDHTGKFPMDVSTNDGGTMEFITDGFRAGQIFYTAFRTFQVLSNELVRPQILVCPSDLREAVSNFPALQNQHLSYFIGANGTFDKPTSVLAGDRNLTTNSVETPTILEIGPGSRLSWTWEMHQFQGNVVFADGHADEWNQSGLKNAGNQLSSDESLFLPSVAAVGANSGPTIQPAIYQPSSTPLPTHPMTAMSSSPPGQTAPASGGMHKSVSGTTSTASGTETSFDTATASTITESNSTAAVSAPGQADVMMSPFDRNLTKTLQHTFGWLYLVLLLLALIYLIYRLLKWMKERDEKTKAKQRG
jgi:prepilin-type N-terminal cleavage/methylation domain-containing protein/prepilin-type processing-associated H-X9-DG protein